jgi:hypothetical protein
MCDEVLEGATTKFFLDHEVQEWHTIMLSQMFIVWHCGSSSQLKPPSPKIINVTFLFIAQSI